MREKWKQVRDRIEADILEEKLASGQQLPTETELARSHSVGRHSVRRAISALAVDGKLRVEQGRGVFVEQEQLINYTIGKRTRLRRNLRAQSKDPSGQLLGSEEVQASTDVAGELKIAQGAPVYRSTRATFADGVPIAYGTAFYSSTRFPGFVERRNALGSVTETYKSYGIADYQRRETSVHVRRARPAEAEILRQHPDQPVMVVRAVDVDLNGTPLSCSRVIWAGARVQFTFDSFDDDGNGRLDQNDV